MKEEIVPALLAAGGGSALLAAVAAHEHRRETAMRRGRQRVALIFPANTDEAAAAAALSALAGLDYRYELMAEVAADESGIKHFLHVPSAVRQTVTELLQASLPGLRIEADEQEDEAEADVAIRITAGRRTLLRDDDLAAATRQILSGCASLLDGETVVLRWALRPGAAAPDVDEASTTTSTTGRAEQRALRARAGLPGFDIQGMLLTRAGSRARATRNAEQVTSALRARRSHGRGLMFRRARRGATAMPRTSRLRSFVLARQLVPLLGWPTGADQIEGLRVGAARRLRVPRDVPRGGRPLLTGSDGRGDRVVALSKEAALHHLLVVGPSGVGKSSLLARGVLAQMESGFGGVVIDPKGGDLIDAVLDRVPRSRARDVIVIDPAAHATPALDLFSSGDPDLRADVLVGALSAIFARVWGVRSETYIRLAVRTAAEIPGATLADAARLLTDPAYRRAALPHIKDTFTLGAWQAFDALSATEQATHIQAPVSRLTGLLARPAVRRVIATPAPKLNMGAVLEQRKWLLVSLAPGRIGEPAASLIGALVMYGLWTAIEARAALPPDRRHPFFVTVDELAAVAQLPVSFELLAERARGFGVGLTLATQTLSRLPESLRRSLVGNVASLVTFRAAAAEAKTLAAELPGLSPDDLIALGRFEAAARVGTGAGSSVAVVTGRSEPLPPPTGLALEIRRRSISEYGASIEPQARHASPNPGESFGRTRRAG